MLKKWQPKWQGEKSLQGQICGMETGLGIRQISLLSPCSGMRFDSDEMALQLLGKERYRYYLTAGVLYADDDIPPDLHRAFLRWIPTYPIFADTAQGHRLLQLWDQEMVKLINDGTLADIYRRNQLYDYYRGFIEEQEKSSDLMTINAVIEERN